MVTTKAQLRWGPGMSLETPKCLLAQLPTVYLYLSMDEEDEIKWVKICVFKGFQKATFPFLIFYQIVWCFICWHTISYK